MSDETPPVILSPEDREYIIDRLVEMLVVEYRQTHGLVVPIDAALSQKRGEV